MCFNARVFPFVFRTTSLPNFLGTFVQPNLAATNSVQNIINNNNNNIINNNINNNNNSKPTVVTVVRNAATGFKVVDDGVGDVDDDGDGGDDDDGHDVPMVVDDVKIETAVNLHALAEDTMLLKSEPEPADNNNRQSAAVKEEDDKTLSPSPFIDINSLPMVFDDTKLFQTVIFICCVFGWREGCVRKADSTFVSPSIGRRKNKKSIVRSHAGSNLLFVGGI